MYIQKKMDEFVEQNIFFVSFYQMRQNVSIVWVPYRASLTMMDGSFRWNFTVSDHGAANIVLWGSFVSLKLK